MSFAPINSVKIMSAAVSAGAAIVGGILYHERHGLEKNRNRIANQLQLVIIPLTANRTQHQSSLEAVEIQNNCSILEHVRHVCELHDVEALENWRGFYLKFLAPLDQEAQQIIKNHAHLIKDGSMDEIFHTFLTTSAKHQFQMEYWISERALDSMDEYNSNDFKPENNCCTFDGYDEMRTQLKELSIKLEEKLSAIEQKLDRHINVVLMSLLETK